MAVNSCLAAGSEMLKKEKTGPITRTRRKERKSFYMKNGTALYTNYQGKRVIAGFLGQDRIFRKQVHTGQKLLVMDAYGIDEPNFRDLRSYGCRGIELTERDTGRKYHIDFSTFESKAIPRQIGKFGVRYYLPLKYWTVAAEAAASRQEA